MGMGGARTSALLGTGLVLSLLSLILMACGGAEATATPILTIPTATPAPTPSPTAEPAPTATPTPTTALLPTETPSVTALVTLVPATASPTATPAPPPTPDVTSLVISTPPPTPKPTNTLRPTPANTPQPTLTPEPTATPTLEPTATPVPAPVPLEWPVDVGNSHFGQLGDSGPGFSGAWIRPHAGGFIWGLIEARQGQYNWGSTDSAVRGWQQDRLAVLVTIWPFAS